MGLQAFTAPGRHLAIGNRPCSDPAEEIEHEKCEVVLANSQPGKFSTTKLLSYRTDPDFDESCWNSSDDIELNEKVDKDVTVVKMNLFSIYSSI